jgi:hypothetical protein
MASVARWAAMLVLGEMEDWLIDLRGVVWIEATGLWSVFGCEMRSTAPLSLTYELDLVGVIGVTGSTG